VARSIRYGSSSYWSQGLCRLVRSPCWLPEARDGAARDQARMGLDSPDRAHIRALSSGRLPASERAISSPMLAGMLQIRASPGPRPDRRARLEAPAQRARLLHT
jgi:hypothetical protein